MRSRIVMLAILPCVFLSIAAMKPSGEAIGKITFPLNRVFVVRAGASDLQFAQFNMPIYPGDKIETRLQSRCEITLDNGDVIRIDENSTFTLDSYHAQKNVGKAESTLGFGKIWANIRKIFSSDDYFTVKSPSAVIAVRGTIYRVDAENDTTTQVRVYEGEVGVSPAGGLSAGTSSQEAPGFGAPTQIQAPTQVAGPSKVTLEKWMEIVTAQQQIVVNADQSFLRSEFDAAEDDQLDWVQWNKKRDRMLEEQ